MTGRPYAADSSDRGVPGVSVRTHSVSLKRRAFLPMLFSSCLTAPLFASEEVVLPDVGELFELADLAGKLLIVKRNAEIRQERHRRELARKGIAEQPASGLRYSKISTGALKGTVFDEWGEIYIDRRFVTDSELRIIRAAERWIAKIFPEQTPKRKQPRRRSGTAGLPVFRGFEAVRYQQHDALISRLTAEFNADKAGWCGGSAAQAAKIADLAPALVKAHMIEESGGNGPASRAAWNVDPLQVNVPGDWGSEKELVGLRKPQRRNEGSLEGNVRAAIKYLSRKGFSAAATPALARPKGYFDGWRRALQRYNGRRDRTLTNRYYSDEYADKIVRRASAPDQFVPIEIRLKK